MPIGGYDPDDLDDRLAELVTEEDLQHLLDADERRAFRDGEQGLFDLLSQEDIETLLERDSDHPRGT